MRKKDDTAAFASILLVEELVLSDGESASVVACCLTLHQLSVFSLALIKKTENERDFMLKYHHLQLILHELDHALMQ